MRLLNRMMLMSRLRRMQWIRWLPPMLRPSPSPVMTQTYRSGRTAFRPVAIAGARPWMEWMP